MHRACVKGAHALDKMHIDVPWYHVIMQTKRGIEGAHVLYVMHAAVPWYHSVMQRKMWA